MPAKKKTTAKAPAVTPEKVAAPAAAAPVRSAPVPRRAKYVALRTIMLTTDICEESGLSSRFLAPESEILLTKDQARRYLDSGSMESLAKRRAREEVEKMDF